MADEKTTNQENETKATDAGVPESEKLFKPLQTTEGTPTEDRAGRPVIVNLPYGSEPVSTGDDKGETVTTTGGNAEGVEIQGTDETQRPKTAKKSSSSSK
ncbi:hypothetical protein [Microvirga sp. Mcv34]|uniref:hypothetical protein n=1 Tax=Microvirga sp. Mcv34 TaxID=2926016 RepID=UPI0021CA7B15|nr:hypothetical protein [Microvirga sp. Mcv34]